MAITTKPRLLLKFAGTPGAALAAAGPVELGLRNVGFRLEPLFQNVPRQQQDLGLEAPSQWFLAEMAEAELETDEVNPWDVAYRALSRGLGVAGAPQPELVEPDLLQSWPYANETPMMSEEQAFAAGEAQVCEFNDQDKRFPIGKPGFAWFLKDEFSQLKSAREAVGDGKRRVRIAHFDTGYDPRHVSLPKHLDTALQRNFVERERPNDASDPAVRGLLRNPGHGTGTLGILAGNKVQTTNDFLGGAPHSSIVPLRVANSVVLFFTSAIAKAFDYILAPQGDPRNRCDVVSMSMGGTASRAWTDAVNAA
ncbi:MAG TPA: S8/S53 family peptidase, partial [Thermoanaerobaculia bacterium]|nr:S8/S53 family peptidase [Thermoanaerobaculia bacterium]